MTDKTAGKKPYGVLRMAILCAGGAFALLVAGFYLASVLVNSIRVPSGQRRAPAQLERLAGFTKDAAEKRTMPTPPPRRDITVNRRAMPTTSMPEPVEASYADYLHERLVRDPGLNAARIYLELLKRRESLIAGYRKQFYRSDGLGELKGSLTPAQAAWLSAQSVSMEKIHALSRAGSLPAPGIEEMVRQIAMMRPTVSPDAYLIKICQDMLGREAMLCLQEGDYVGARRAIVDAWELCGLWNQVMYMAPSFWSYAGDPAQWALSEWVERGGSPPGETKALLAELDRIERDFMENGKLQHTLAGEYLMRRAQLVWIIETMPWNSPHFGWNIDSPYYRFTVPLSRTRNTSIEIPRLDRIVERAMSAMRAKSSAPQMLPDLDKLAEASFAAAKLSFPEFLKHMKAIETRPESRIWITFRENRYLQDCVGVYPNIFKITFHRQEAKMHLIRVGLEWLLNPQTAMEMRINNFVGKPHDPWRDPFTEKPLQVDSATTTTLLWSLGPDLKDQRGLVTYDPTNGTMSAGDIAVHLAR